jgi:hypothetical protein
MAFSWQFRSIVGWMCKQTDGVPHIRFESPLAVGTPLDPRAILGVFQTKIASERSVSEPVWHG